MERAVDSVFGVEKETKQIFATVTLCFFFSGTTGLIYEVLWTRILGLVFGPTVVAITTVLAAFMAGLGLGSYLFGGIADRNAHPLRLYGIRNASSQWSSSPPGWFVRRLQGTGARPPR